MTRTEAESLMRRHGCTDTTKPAETHSALVRWIDRYGRGEVPHERMGEAYHVLRTVEPPAAKQVALFEKWRTE
jgi:hypothetical protein